ncbi:hypothetical protein [Lentzea alba]|nr:hypothetical protein [Lentzea alba]
MAADPVQPVPAPQPPEPPQPVVPVDWFRRMPTGGGTVYLRPTD